MKKAYLALGLGFALVACNQHPEKGDFKIDVQLENVPLTHITLDQLGMEGVKIVDSVTLHDASGKFTLKGIVSEQGLYRIHFGDEKNKDILLALDAGDIQIKGDYNNLDKVTVSGSEATAELQQLLREGDAKGRAIQQLASGMDTLQGKKGMDSILLVKQKAIETAQQQYETWFFDYAKNAKSPAVAAFALGSVPQQVLMNHQKDVEAVSKKFPNNSLIKSVTGEVLDKPNQAAAAQPGGDQAAVKDGQEAPDFTLNTPDGKAVSLKSLRGKYVLVDFWASWCPPCRAENPNVVAAFNEFKGKNFTILGVSLDKDKAAWEKAISDDHLTWTHVSDLKFWDSKVVSLYGIEGIPFNFLLDPQGKVVGSNLRGPALQEKLKAVL